MSSIFDKTVPGYGNWCGPGRGKAGSDVLTENDIPKDAKDSICWLHDYETKKAKTHKLWNWFVAMNTANYNFTKRQDHQDEIAKFASDWWSERLGKSVEIKVQAFDEDYSRLYKPLSRVLFAILSIKLLVNQKLLAWSIDEDLAGSPPVF